MVDYIHLVYTFHADQTGTSYAKRIKAQRPLNSVLNIMENEGTRLERYIYLSYLEYLLEPPNRALTLFNSNKIYNRENIFYHLMFPAHRGYLISLQEAILSPHLIELDTHNSTHTLRILVKVSSRQDNHDGTLLERLLNYYQDNIRDAQRQLDQLFTGRTYALSRREKR